MKRMPVLPGLMALILFTACPDFGGSEGDDAGVDAGDADAGNSLCDPVPMDCDDAMIQQLALQSFVSSGAVTTSESAGVFTTVIDATAGGMSGANDNPYVYVKFETDGVVKVEIDDEDALETQDWDLAARRFILRLNSGDSGISCVSAAAVSGEFGSVSAIPASFAVENFYSASCDYITDSRFSGFDGPDTLLKEFWEMNGMCVATTGQVFVLELADGRHIKLVVDAYYATGQDGCNLSGSAGGGSGTLTIRWAWL